MSKSTSVITAIFTKRGGIMKMEYPVAYACYNKDEKIRRHSTSGGVFSILAEYFLNSYDAVVYGAAYNTEFEVEHVRVTDRNELGRLRGSKYAQSSVGNSYAMVKQDLERKKTVLFTGTPCQIYGLYAYLGKQYESLWCMDFVCHGVASRKVWRGYLQKMASKGKIKDIFIKDKYRGWKKWYFKIEYENYVWRRRGTLTEFMRSYLHYCCIRPSCYNCRFKGLNRISDFTISDAWGIAEQDVLNDNRGLSALLLQNQRATEVFAEIADKMIYKSYDANALMEGNWTTFRSVTPNPIRKEFFESVNKYGAKVALEKHFKASWKEWSKYILKYILGKE